MASVHREGEAQLKCTDYSGPARAREGHIAVEAIEGLHANTHTHTKLFSPTYLQLPVFYCLLLYLVT